MSNRYSSYDKYGLRHLPQHLVRSGRGERLREMLFEFDWLQSKLDTTDAAALLADFELLPSDEALRLVLGALRVSTHIIASDKSQLASRLTGQLLSSEVAGINAFLKEIRGSKNDPWLRPLTVSFTPPGDPLLYTLTGSEGSITALAVTPDGKRAVSISFDTLRVWNLESGTMLSAMTMPDRWSINALAVTSDGSRAILGLANSAIKVWDLERGTEMATLQGHTYGVTGVAVTPDGQRAISASRDKTLKIWDLERGKELVTLQSDEWVEAVTVTLDGMLAVSVGHTLKIWDLEGGKELATLEGHKLDDHMMGVNSGSASEVSVTPDGGYAVSAIGNALTLWDLNSAKEISNLWDYRGQITAVAVTPDGKRAVSGGTSSEPLKLWDLEGRKKLATLEGHTDEVTAVVITLDGKRAISASKDKTLKVWDLEGNLEDTTHEGHAGKVTALAVTPDCKRAILGTNYDVLKVWDLEHDTELATLVHRTEKNSDLTKILSASFIALMRPPAWVTAVKVTPDGTRIISGSRENTLKVWDLEHGAELATLRGHSHWVNAIAVTSEGKRIISGSQDNTLKVWDLERGTELATLQGHSKPVTAVTITPDGKRIISGSEDDTLKVWDLERGTELATLQGHAHLVKAIAVTPDGRRAVSGDLFNTLTVWDLESGTELASLQCRDSGDPGFTGIRTIAVTPDGRYSVTGESHLLTLRALEDLKIVATFTGDAGMDTCEIAGDGTTIVVGDKLERVHVLRMENVVSGPFIVTAWRFSTHILILKWASYAFGCPSCRNWSKIHSSALGTEIRCPRCDARIRLNTFVINADWRPIANAWSSIKTTG